MSTSLSVQIFLFLLAVSCLISAGFVSYAIIGEINRKLPEEDQIPYFLGQRGKYVSQHEKFARVRREYRRLYPGGRMALYLNFLTFAGFGLLLAIALGWRLGIFK